MHQLWIVRGIKNDPTIANCSIKQPDFAAEQAAGNLSFRIPTQMFGMGLIDAIQDREILNRYDATAAQRAALGVTGHPNRSANDGTIARFGWKAQNKSIPMFAGEAKPRQKRTQTATGQQNPRSMTSPAQMMTMRSTRHSPTRSTSWPTGCNSRC